MQRSAPDPTPPSGGGLVLLRLRLIGQMEAWTTSSESILPTGRKTRALLAIVALLAPRPVLRGRMAEMLWSRRPEEQARASLRQEIHRLHDALDPLGPRVLAITRDHLALRAGTVWVDVEELLRATPGRPAALGLYDGDLLEGLDGVDPAFDGWLHGERQRLGDRARAVAETMLRDQTEPEQMIQVAQQLLRIDRAHEGAWRALMRAHLANGERGMAIQAYDRCRLVLAEQLDAQPSAETQRLLADVRSAMPPSRQIAAGSGPDSASPAGRSPVPPRPAGRVLPPVGEAEPHARSTLVEAEPTATPTPAPASPAVRLAGPRTTAPRGGARVGVLPLQLLGTTPAEAHLAQGLAHDITSALARFRWLWLATATSLGRAAATPARDEDALRTAFGLDFLVDGAVQRGGERLRVSLRLLDLRDGHHEVWSDRFEGGADDLLLLQDEVAAAAAARIEPELQQAEGEFAAQGPAGEACAYDLLMQALSLMSRLDRARCTAAGEMLRQALAAEPESAALHTWTAYWWLLQIGQGWAADLSAAEAEAVDHAERAISLDAQSARALTIAGHIRASLQHRPREALALHDRSLSLNPNLPMAWSLSGMAFAYQGELDEAERRIAIARKLAPGDRQASFLEAAPVMVALLRHDHQAAVRLGRELSSINAAAGPVVKPYLAALGHLHMEADAAPIRTRLLAQEPGFRIEPYLSSIPLQRDDDRAHVAAGLRLAGFEA